MQQLAAEATAVVDASDIRLSQFIIVQGQSRVVREMGATPGLILHTLTNEQFHEIEFVVSFIKKTRTRFSKVIGDSPLCQSPNAMDGYGDPGDQLAAQGAKGPQGGGACARCPESVVNFQTGQIGSCALQFNFIGFRTGEGANPELELPMVIQMQRTSMRSAQNLVSLLGSLRFPWASRIKLTSKEQRNKEGQDFFVWQISKGSEASAIEQRRAFEIARLVRNADNVTVEQSQDIVDVTPSNGSAPQVTTVGAAPAVPDDIPF